MNSFNNNTKQKSMYFSWVKKLLNTSKASKVEDEKIELFKAFIVIVEKLILRSNTNQYLLNLNKFYISYIVFAPNGSINKYFEYLTSIANNQNKLTPNDIIKMHKIIEGLKQDLHISETIFIQQKSKLYKTLRKK